MNERREARRSWGRLALKAAAGLATLGGVALAGLGIVRKVGPTSGWSATGARTHPASAASLDEGYEVKDLSAKGLGIIVLALGLSAGALIGVVFGMIALFASWDRQSDRGLTAEQTAPIAVPGPHVQWHPIRDHVAEVQRQEAELRGYGWNDPGHTSAHVPIGRAMAIVDGHSLDGTR